MGPWIHADSLCGSRRGPYNKWPSNKYFEIINTFDVHSVVKLSNPQRDPASMKVSHVNPSLSMINDANIPILIFFTSYMAPFRKTFRHETIKLFCRPRMENGKGKGDPSRYPDLILTPKWRERAYLIRGQNKKQMKTLRQTKFSALSRSFGSFSDEKFHQFLICPYSTLNFTRNICFNTV